MKLGFVRAQQVVITAMVEKKLPSSGYLELVEIVPLVECVFDCDIAPNPSQIARIKALQWIDSVSLNGKRLTVVILQNSVPKPITELDLGIYFAELMG